MAGSQLSPGPGPNLSGKAKVANHSKAKSERAPNVKRAKKTILTHNLEGRQRVLQGTIPELGWEGERSLVTKHSSAGEGHE